MKQLLTNTKNAILMAFKIVQFTLDLVSMNMVVQEMCTCMIGPYPIFQRCPCPLYPSLPLAFIGY